jgi:hypothetical protein
VNLSTIPTALPLSFPVRVNRAIPAKLESAIMTFTTHVLDRRLLRSITDQNAFCGSMVQDVYMCSCEPTYMQRGKPVTNICAATNEEANKEADANEEANTNKEADANEEANTNKEANANKEANTNEEANAN